MNQKIKIYSDKKYLHPGERHEISLYPFWGKNKENVTDPDAGRFDEYQRTGSNFFELTTVADCDVAILPSVWNREWPEAVAFLSMAEAVRKPVLLFFNNDSTEDIPLKNGWIFRTSFYRSTRKSNEFATPGWSQDFLKHYLGGRLPIRFKTKTPVISYCGYAGDWKFRLKRLLGLPTHPGLSLRTEATDILRQSKIIKTNFLIRSGFWAGVYKNGTASAEEILSVRKEYVANLVSGDYVLCTRGGGNFSYRFYETLSVGRIPVLVDTDCVLPYDQFIPWKEICVLVEAKNIKQIDKAVAEFHANLSDVDFLALQKKCRQVWEEWIAPVGFFKNLHKIIQQ